MSRVDLKTHERDLRTARDIVLNDQETVKYVIFGYVDNRYLDIDIIVHIEDYLQT